MRDLQIALPADPRGASAQRGTGSARHSIAPGAGEPPRFSVLVSNLKDHELKRCRPAHDSSSQERIGTQVTSSA